LPYTFLGEEANQQREMSEAFKSRGYIQSGSSRPLSPADEAIVVQLVNERVQAKKDREFDLADDIRERLLEEYNVYMQDKSKLWSVGGDFTSEGGGTLNDYTYTRVGGGGETINDEDLELIIDMVTNRAKARKDRDYDVADELSDTLYAKYKVRTDDSNKQWWIETEGYTQEPQSPSCRVLNEDEVSAVEDMLMERLQVKMERNFEAADAIREELKNVYSVEVNDRTRSWRTLEDQSSGSRDRRSENAPATNIQSMLSEEGEGEEVYEEEEDDDENDEASTSFFAEKATSPSTKMSPEYLAALTVPELKLMLRNAGKPVSGKKAELVDRILE
jgi:hypothetical protein